MLMKCIGIKTNTWETFLCFTLGKIVCRWQKEEEKTRDFLRSL